jgi:hypothetical protein
MLAAHQAGVARLLRGEPSQLVGGTAELPAVHADGRQLLVELSLSGWTQDGRNGFTAVLRDITARHRTELLADLLRTAASTANSAPGLRRRSADRPQPGVRAAGLGGRSGLDG